MKKEEAPKKLPVIEQEKEAPKKTPLLTDQKLLVKKFRIEGNTILNAEALHALTAPHEGKELTLEEIRNLADLITAKYRDAGYIIVNAFVPAQEVWDRIVVIKVVEGKVGEISVTGNKHYGSSFIEKHLARINKDPSLKEERLERSLLILNDYPSLNVAVSLKAGKTPGTTDVIATAADKFAMSGRLFYDNYGSNTTNKNRAGFALDIGNILTDGDIVNLWGITGLDKISINQLSYGRAEYSLPIGYNGTRAGIYYANNLYQATGDLTPLGYQGSANIAGVYVSHPFIKTREATLGARIGFDYKDIREYALSNLMTTDRIRPIGFGMSYDLIDRYLGRNFINVTYYQGIRNFLNGAGSNDPNVSRLGADGNFGKVTADAIRIQKLPGYNHLILRASGQYSSDPLFLAEQFMLGGTGSVRGFNPAEATGDIGYTGSIEIAVSPIFPESTVFNQKIGDTIKFAFFADTGYVRRNSPLPGENQQTYMTGIGGGVRLYAGKVLSLKLDYGIPKVDSTFETRESVTYVQGIISF
ncbi:MAG: BamA/TamA family outer membrane protein [Proteobacteria bacterium]|nr:BamA/TamA family outer membrane protein [Pseudomonadota bacterium]